MHDRRQRAGRGTQVLCVFLDAPTDDSTVSTRWRRLAQYVCSLGEATVVVRFMNSACVGDLSGGTVGACRSTSTTVILCVPGRSLPSKVTPLSEMLLPETPLT